MEFDPKDYVKKDLNEANKIAESKGYITHIVELNGVMYVTVSDNEKMIKFRISNNIVIGAFI